MGSSNAAIIRLKLKLLNKEGSLTPQEGHILGKCIEEGARSFLTGIVLGGGIAFAATRKMVSLESLFSFTRILSRAAIMSGAATIVGACALERTQRLFVQEILALDGTQLQKELVTIIAKDFRDNTSLMRLVSRHFYEEKVFNDSSSDSTVIRWRYRNVFSDNVLYGDKPQDHGSQVEYGRSPHGHDSHADSRVASISDSNDKKVSVKSKQLPIDNSSDGMDDPLDPIFGHTTPVEEIQLPSGTGPTKDSARNHKRSHRTRLRRRHKASADCDHVQPQRI